MTKSNYAPQPFWSRRAGTLAEPTAAAPPAPRPAPQPLLQIRRKSWLALSVSGISQQIKTSLSGNLMHRSMSGLVRGISCMGQHDDNEGA